MNAERIYAMDLPFPVAGIRAGKYGRVVYAHREGLWLNTQLASTVVEKGMTHSEEIIRIALALLACKFDVVENLLKDVLLKKWIESVGREGIEMFRERGPGDGVLTEFLQKIPTAMEI